MDFYNKLLASFGAYAISSRQHPEDLYKSAAFKIPKKQLQKGLSIGRRGRKKTRLSVKVSNKNEYNLDDIYAIFLGRLLIGN